MREQSHTWQMSTPKETRNSIQQLNQTENGETEAQLHEALETITKKGAGVRNMSKKLDTLEIELGYYEEQATEAAANEEKHKVKFDEVVHKLKSLEAQLAETQNKVDLFQNRERKLDYCQ